MTERWPLRALRLTLTFALFATVLVGLARPATAAPGDPPPCPTPITSVAATPTAVPDSLDCAATPSGSATATPAPAGFGLPAPAPYRDQGIAAAPGSSAGATPASAPSATATPAPPPRPAAPDVIAEDEPKREIPPMPRDTSPPTLRSATVNGSDLTLRYDEPLSTWGLSPSRFGVEVDGNKVEVEAASASGRVVTLTLAEPVAPGAAVVVWSAPRVFAVVDRAGNAAAALERTSPPNLTPYPDCAPDTFASCIEGIAVIGALNEGAVVRAKVFETEGAVQVLLENAEGGAELAALGVTDATVFEIALRLRAPTSTPSALVGLGRNVSWSVAPRDGYYRVVVRVSAAALQRSPGDALSAPHPSATAVPRPGEYRAAVQLALFDVGAAVTSRWDAVTAALAFAGLNTPPPSVGAGVACEPFAALRADGSPLLSGDRCDLLESVRRHGGDVREALAAADGDADVATGPQATDARGWEEGLSDEERADLHATLGEASPQFVLGALGGNSATGFVLPAEGTLTQDYHGGHLGIDIATAMGEPMRAVAAGRIALVVQDEGSYGWHIVIDHGNGLETLYAHAGAIDVRVGDLVTEHDIIARIGMTGKTTGPHIHFEVRRNGIAVDPRLYVADLAKLPVFLLDYHD